MGLATRLEAHPQPWWRDLVLGVPAGTVLGALPALLLALVGFPGIGETLASSALVLGVFVPVGLPL